MIKDKQRIVFILVLLGLAGAFFLAAVFAGHRMVVSGQILYNDLLFGVDAARNIDIFTTPGIHNIADLERSNVHPLFSLVVKPWAGIIQTLGITRGTSAVIVNALVSALALLLAPWYLRRRRLDRVDAVLLTLLMGASATWICMSSIPGSYMFSLNVIILSFIMTQWTLERPDATLSAPARWGREALWLGAGLLNYGITVSNGMMSFLAYGFGRSGRRGWVRAVAYGAIVLGLGLLLTIIVGSSTNMIAEKQWYFNPQLRAQTPPWMNVIVAATPLLWSFVVPWPTFHTYQPLDPRNPILSEKIPGILQWNFTGLDWILIACWALVLLAALRAAVTDRDPIGRRLSCGLAACLSFHIVMHRFYYHAFEGVFFFTPHSLFLVIGLCAPFMLQLKTWPNRAKWIVRTLLLMLAMALLIRNLHYFLALREIIPLPVFKK